MSDSKLCPFCGEEIKSIAIKCKHCGSMLTPTGTDQPVSSITLVKQALASKYEIIEEIGKGGMATVYRALQKNLHREVALKVIHQNLIHDSEFVARFHREAQVCANLSHPNIVTVYDEGEINGVHFMAMELLSGTDLHRLIHQKGRLEAEEAIRYIAPIAQALDHAHRKGLIHRDVKSSNIIITIDGRSVLTDFGIAHAAEGTKLTQTGTIIGTPEYMSPEQAEGKPLDHRSDIYSLGIVLYECLSGKVPFKGDNPLTTIHKIIYDQPEPLSRISGIPQWIEQIVTQCLEKDVTRRIPSGALLSNSFTTREIGIQEEDPPLPPEKPRKLPKKNGSTFSIIVKISSFFLLTIFLIPPVVSLPISSDLIGIIVILILTISGLLIFGNNQVRKIVGIISLSALIIGLLSFLVFYFQNKDFTVNKLLGGGEKELAEKRIADSILIADSMAMVQVEQQRVADSITDAQQEEVRRRQKIQEQEHQQSGTFTDNRDGKIYKWVRIGNQTWMAVNLAYIESGGLAYKYKESNVAIYGYLYNLETACKVCPSGWHLPSDEEWTQLIDFLGGEEVAGGKLKETGINHWNSPNTGATNETGFTALPGGISSYANNTFSDIGKEGYWWSSTNGGGIPWKRKMSSGNTTVIRYCFNNEENGLSVRCLKN